METTRTTIFETRIRRNIREFNIQISHCRRRLRDFGKKPDQDGQHCWEQQLFQCLQWRTKEERKLALFARRSS